MEYQFQITLLREKIRGDWGRSSILVLNRAVEIRQLVSILGAPFLILDDVAMNIETIAGTALGMGDSMLTEEDMVSLNYNLKNLKEIFVSLTKEVGNL